MKPRTIFLGRFLGLFTLIASLWFLVERQAALSDISELLADRSAMLIFASIALAGGLAIVLAHNIGSGGVLPVLVTLSGWVMLIRGVFFLLLSPDTSLMILAFMQVERFFYIYFGIPFLLGVYLAYLGFTAHSRSA